MIKKWKSTFKWVTLLQINQEIKLITSIPIYSLVYIANAATKHTNIELVHCDGTMYTAISSANDEPAINCIELGGM